MNLYNSYACVYYNLVSNFYICLNLLFPYYNEDILQLQYKSIEQINESTIFENNSRKRKRFNIFIENLIQKNNDLLERIRQQEEEDNNINNYEKIDLENTEVEELNNNEVSDSSSAESDDENKEGVHEQPDIQESDDKKHQ